MVVLNSFDKKPFGDTKNDYTMISKGRKEEIENADKATISLEIYHRIKDMKRDSGEPGMNCDNFIY